MNNDIIEGNWKQMKGAVQKKWGDLTDDQLDQINGSRKELVGKIQETYGKGRDEAEKEVRDWEESNAA
ncbi:MAG TPA: CsbD family protein [Alphaproteobacteria bacterium]|nr:CsbD family protein [Alphaproteobacteria bacterium]